jgi:hypothetical protein
MRHMKHIERRNLTSMLRRWVPSTRSDRRIFARRIMSLVALSAMLAGSFGLPVDIPIARAESGATETVPARTSKSCCSISPAAVANGCACSPTLRAAGRCCCAGTKFGIATKRSCCGDKSAKSQQVAQKAEPQRRANLPTWQSCACGLEHFAGMLVCSHPRILSQGTNSSLGQYLEAELVVFTQLLPEISFSPSTPPPKLQS